MALCAAIRGVDGEVCPMGYVISGVIVSMSGVAGVVLGAWWQARIAKHEAKAFHERAEEQEKKLAVVNAELQLLRVSVSRLQSEITAVEFEVAVILQGPASKERASAE